MAFVAVSVLVLTYWWKINRKLNSLPTILWVLCNEHFLICIAKFARYLKCKLLFRLILKVIDKVLSFLKCEALVLWYWNRLLRLGLLYRRINIFSKLSNISKNENAIRCLDVWLLCRKSHKFIESIFTKSYIRSLSYWSKMRQIFCTNRFFVNFFSKYVSM